MSDGIIERLSERLDDAERTIVKLCGRIGHVYEGCELCGTFKCAEEPDV